MISPIIYDFLTKLSENNSREWYHANKDLYSKAKYEFEILTIKLISIVNEVDASVGFMQPNDCTFRIFRDTRFSNDKTPYKTNFGAYVNREGKKSRFAGYYLHVQPGQSFIACGLHMPDAAVLNAVRQEIYHMTDEYKTIINNAKVKQKFGEVVGDKLKMAPKGFDKSFVDIDLIKFKSFNLIKYYTNAQLMDASFEAEIRNMFELMRPFNQFFNRVIADLNE
jgi:uncharacterized protein (TIGR02453 family)